MQILIVSIGLLAVVLIGIAVVSNVLLKFDLKEYEEELMTPYKAGQLLSSESPEEAD